MSFGVDSFQVPKLRRLIFDLHGRSNILVTFMTYPELNSRYTWNVSFCASWLGPTFFRLFETFRSVSFLFHLRHLLAARKSLNVQAGVQHVRDVQLTLSFFKFLFSFRAITTVFTFLFVAFSRAGRRSAFARATYNISTTF